ncbi:hypothetical protein ACFQ1S_31395, partial [Kibdelosporangium lantanae]
MTITRRIIRNRGKLQCHRPSRRSSNTTCVSRSATRTWEPRQPSRTGSIRAQGWTFPASSWRIVS